MFPLELVTMLGSGALSGLMTLWGKAQENKKLERDFMLESLTVQQDHVHRARMVKSKGFQFTRRVISLVAVFSVVLWPKLVAVFFPDVSVTIGWTEWNPGFLFVEGRDTTVWHTVQGLVLTPLDTHLMSAIIGLYFGASVVKNSS